MSAPAAKRSRSGISQAAGSAVQVNELAHCLAIQLKGSDISPWREHVLLHDLLRGSLLRVRVAMPDGSATCVVARYLSLGEKVAPYDLQLPSTTESASSEVVQCSTSLCVMLLGRPGAAPDSLHKPTQLATCKLNRVSSSDITKQEWALAVQCIQLSRSKVPRGKEPPSWCRSLTQERITPVQRRQARLLTDLPTGGAVATVSTGTGSSPHVLWGRQDAGQPPHGVVLLLRSWLAASGPVPQGAQHCPVLVPPHVVKDLQVLPGAGAVAAAAAGASERQTDVFRAALGGAARAAAWAEGDPLAGMTAEHMSSLLEAGAFGQSDKFRGHFSFLALVPDGGKKDGGCTLLTHAADATHECKPEMTAFHAMRKHLPFTSSSFTLQTLQDAIVDSVGLTPQAAAESDSATALPARVLQSETMATTSTGELPSAAKASGECVLSSHEAYTAGSAVFRCQAPPQWRRRRRERHGISGTQVVIVDMDALLRAGAMRWRVLEPGPPADTPPLAAFHWVPEDYWTQTPPSNLIKTQVRSMLQQPCLLGHTALGGGAAGRRNAAPLYHGCSVSAAACIVSGGFRRPVCRALARCRDGVCFCQMHGMGVYFARADKALSFGKRRAQPLGDATGGISTQDIDALKGACSSSNVEFVDLRPQPGAGPLGAVLLCQVDLGRCKVQMHTRDRAYPELPGTEYTDHTGRWYAWEGYDSVHLLDGSAPVARLAEWCVSDPGRITITHCFLTANSTTADEILQTAEGHV